MIESDVQRELNKEWYDGIYQMQKAVAITNITVLNRQSLAMAIWEGIIKFHSKEYSYWNVGMMNVVDCQEYIQFDRVYNQGKETRGLFRRAAAGVEDYKEYIISGWEEYERFYGTLETWNEFIRKSMRYRQIFEEKQERKREHEEEKPTSEEKRPHLEPSITKTKKTIREKKNDVSVQKRTVFVNNLSFSASEDDLKNHFEKYGKITHVNVVRNNHGKSRGFAYIEYEQEEDTHKAIEENNQLFMNRKLEVKLSVPQEQRKTEKKEVSGNAAAIACTIYVSGLPKGIGEYEFSVFFSKVCDALMCDVQCGKVISCKVLRDKLTKVGKGTGLLQFDNESGVEEALKLDGQTWKDNTLHIQKSKYPVPHYHVYYQQTSQHQV